ncbi:MAG: 4Fe-4S binding protein [Acidobacteria bacterium]|nr:MAG: 4Fe-4S binding protein [Acidobacteriota bacterium]
MWYRLGRMRFTTILGKRGALSCVLIASALLPALLAWLFAPPPQTRDMHIEAFRYGFSPSRIQVNRGDHLRLTFSTRDTGQSFFLQDYDRHVVISPGTELVEVQRLSRPEEPPLRTSVVELRAGLEAWWGPFVSKSQFRNHTYNGPMHGTERGDLIVGPNYLLASGLGLLCAIPFAVLLLGVNSRGTRSFNLFALAPWLKRLVKWPSFQFALTIPMLAVFYFVILAGFFGTKVSGRNAGPMVIWVVWLSALIVTLVPLGGRVWCLACPLPSLGEWLQRRRLAAPSQQQRAPAAIWIWGPLSGAWPRTIFFLLLGTFSMALVAVPAATSWLLVGLALLAILMSFGAEQRGFCRHLCPINSFISLYSMTGRLMVRSVSPDTCARCREHFCLNGSSAGWGCPYGLCLGEVKRNNDCGVCTECVKTCAYDNVAVFWRFSGWDRGVANRGEAWQAIVMFSLGVIYCVLNLGPWHQVRDWVDIVDKQNWGSFSIFSAAVWLLLLGLLPMLLYVLTRIGLGISRATVAPGAMFRASCACLVPLGLAFWVAFAVALFSSMSTFVLLSLSDPFNWGWDLLGTAGKPWYILWSPAIAWLQVASVLVGLVYSLKALRLAWESAQEASRVGLPGALPWACFLWLVAGAMVWFYAG